MGPFLFAAVVFGLLAAGWRWNARRAARRAEIAEDFSEFLHPETVKALLRPDAPASFKQDEMWIRDSEKELVARFGSCWIAVRQGKVLGAAAGADDAWRAAQDGLKARVPYVRRIGDGDPRHGPVNLG